MNNTISLRDYLVIEPTWHISLADKWIVDWNFSIVIIKELEPIVTYKIWTTVLCKPYETSGSFVEHHVEEAWTIFVQETVRYSIWFKFVKPASVWSRKVTDRRIVAPFVKSHRTELWTRRYKKKNKRRKVRLSDKWVAGSFILFLSLPTKCK